MRWIRELIEKVPSFKAYETHISTIENSVETNPALCIETSKSFIEGICKTILTNQGQTLNDDTQFQVLVKRTLEQLITQSGEDLSELPELGRRTASVAQKIAEIRNNAGFATHGLDIAHPHIDKILSLFIYKITDVIGGFIMYFYINHVRNGDTRILYEDCEYFNNWFDDENPLEIGGVIISASEALYNLDYQAYKANYVDFIDLELNKE